MANQNGFKNLIVWQRSKELVIEIYKTTQSLPRSELYGLVSQMRRAAVSIPANIAEGYRRFHKKDKRQFFLIAFGSGAELESHLDIAKTLYPKVNFSKAEKLLNEVMKMLNKIINDSKTNSNKK